MPIAGYSGSSSPRRLGTSGWLDVNKVASVEVTSEDQNFPIESALLGDHARGWRAAESGTQTIRLVFDTLA